MMTKFKTMFINLRDDQLVITFKYDPKIVAAIRSLPGRQFNTRLKHWEISAEHVIEVLDVLEPLGFTATLPVKRRATEQRAHFKLTEELRTDPGMYKGNLPLYDFQKIGASFLMGMPAALLADVPGLGKSIQALAAIEGTGRCLILCPASLKYSWKEEIEKWQKDKTITVIDGNSHERKKQWGKNSAYTIANYELLLFDYPYIPKDWPSIVCDEATRISNPNAKSVKALKTITAKRKIALTGTPVSNSPEDLFSIIDWLKPGYLGNFYQFQDRYCVKEPRFHRIVGYKNLPHLAELISRFTLRRTKEEVLKDFPAKTIKNIVFDLSVKERKWYDAVRLQIIEELQNMDGSTKTLNLMPVKMLRLKQVTDHPRLVSQSWNESSKLQALKDILEPIIKSGEKTIIFTQFAKMANILLMELNIHEPRFITGEVPAEDRQRAVNEFSEDPKCKIIIMTEAGAYGLNLQAASYVCHYDAPWSIAKLMQREDRAHRIGQNKPVTVYNLVARDTIDEYVSKVLHRKQKVSVELLKDYERLEEFGLTQEDINLILRLK